MPCFRYRRLPVACASKSPRRCSASGAGNAYLYLTTFGRREQEAKINKKRTRFLWRNGDGNGKDDGTDRKHFRAGHTGSAENHPAIPAEHHKISAGTGNRSGRTLWVTMLAWLISGVNGSISGFENSTIIIIRKIGAR